MQVYLLWIQDPDDGETVLKAVFSSYDLAQSYADEQHYWWYSIDQVTVNDVD